MLTVELHPSARPPPGHRRAKGHFMTISMPSSKSAARAVAAATVAGLVLVAGGASAQTSPPGLPDEATGPRPGPAALYAPPAIAPQLENVAPWTADPILISGAQAYRGGEWMYQDFLFDDHGATGVDDPESPWGVGSHLYSPTGGTFTYPLDSSYAHNAADLVEMRIRPLADATAIRVTLNTLIDPELVAFTVALGDGPGATWPNGAGATSPADVFVTFHGGTATLTDAVTGLAIEPAASAAVDLVRRQVDLRIPTAAWDPGRDTHHVTIGVGLWDAANDSYLAADPLPATATTPGGGSLIGSSLVNVGPRLDEPTPLLAGVTMADTAAGAKALAPWWRERQQSQQLLLGDLSPFGADVDFGALMDGVDDDSGVPTSGPMDRILASRYEFGQGLEPDRVCFSISGGENLGADCMGRFVGQLQQYAIYVPEGTPPANGWGMTLLLHSLSANHNQYLGTKNQTQLGERGSGSIVVTPEARGPDGFYAGIPEANTFEVWADAARHYPVDPTWASVSGYSMGGFGTYRMLARWPDLFASGFSVVGEPGSVEDQLASMSNHTFLSWNSAADELVNINTSEAAYAGLVEAGIDTIHDLYLTADHLTLAGNDEYQPGADFLGEARADRSPPTVTFVVDPREDSLDVVADHAYWLSELSVRDAEAAPIGTIEVHSAAFGVGRTTASEGAPGAGALTGGNTPALAFAERTIMRTEAAAEPTADRIEVTATNISRVVVDPVRARVTCGADVVVDSDGPIEVVLAGCPATPATAAPSTAPANGSDPAAAPAAVATTGSAGPLPTTGGGLALLSLATLALGAVASRRRE